MIITLARLLRVAALVTVVTFCVSGALRNADHGVGLLVGDVAWFTFLAGLLASVVLGATWAARGLLRRRAQHRLAR